MIVLDNRNVNEALVKGFRFIKDYGIRRESRAGPVLVIEEPVTTVYRNPRERVLSFRERDANPFFHFMESLWMLEGRNDVAFVGHYARNMFNFSDNGVSLHGAYGYRWGSHFGYDQLQKIAELLIENKQDRRIVLQMWDADSDLGKEGKDFPCNTQILFRVSPYGKLDMTVFNRSNDMIWGAYGANAVHMSMLQEFMASWIGIEVGVYWQVSNNFHAYLDTMEQHKEIGLIQYADYYDVGRVEPFPMVNTDIVTWQQDLNIFMSEGPIIGFQDVFFRKVATPIYHSWEAWKKKDIKGAKEIVSQCVASDWRVACTEWLEKRDRDNV